MASLEYLQSRLWRGVRIGLLLTSLVAITVAVACAGGDDGGDDDSTSTPGSTAPAGSTSTPRPGSSPTATPPPGSTPTPRPQPTATPTPVPTATPVPPNSIAAAGNDLDTRIGNFVGLNGSGSSDPDGEPLTYTWTQVNGPDVTGGVGRFVGPTPSFQAPLRVSTLVFELTVNDGNAESFPDTVQINVFEHIGNPGLFVDGNSGSDETGDGTRTAPFASISFAISRINGPDQDIHVMSMTDGSAYEEENTISPPTTTSLYGGYGPGWVRNVDSNKTRINGASTAVRFGVVDEPAWFSGFDVVAGDGAAGGSVYALRVDNGGSTFVVEDNILTAGNGGNASDVTAGGSSQGIFVGQVFNVEILRNTVTVGNGGSGADGPNGSPGATAESAGSRGQDGEDGGVGGAGGKGGNSSINGGRGGNGGKGVIPEDGSGGGGGGGPAGNGGNGDPVGSGGVGDGFGGGGGAGGDGGDGGSGTGSFTTAGEFAAGDGTAGENGGNGGGGGGGGGGAGGVGLTGGGGGGGGGGGAGGKGGTGGKGGGASIGILIYAAVSSTVEDNTVIAGSGGNGGAGGLGGGGGDGKAGAVGGTFVCSFLGCNVGRSGDAGEGGGGGAGGRGGRGGGGAGGPSYGIVIGPNVSIEIIDSNVSAGNGGRGGSGGNAGQDGAAGSNGSSTGGAGGSGNVLASGTAGSGGDGGWSFAVFDLDTNDGSPVLTRTQLIAGQPGAGISIDGAPGESGETNF